MEINNYPPPTMSPTRQTAAVGDGDVGQNRPYYRGNQRKSKKNPDEHSEEITSGFEDNSSLIDIRV